MMDKWDFWKMGQKEKEKSIMRIMANPVNDPETNKPITYDQMTEVWKKFCIGTAQEQGELCPDIDCRWAGSCKKKEQINEFLKDAK